MIRNALKLGGTFSVVLLAACSAGTEAPPAAPQPQPGAVAPAAPAAPAAGARTTLDGVFTAAQATRGQQVFTQMCAGCHSTSEWTNPAFLQTWTGVPLHDFFTQIHDTMPMDAPGSLTREEYTDVIAYMLQLNNLPVGSMELPSDEAGQRAVVIQPRPGE